MKLNNMKAAIEFDKENKVLTWKDAEKMIIDGEYTDDSEKRRTEITEDVKKNGLNILTITCDCGKKYVIDTKVDPLENITCECERKIVTVGE